MSLAVTRCGSEAAALLAALHAQCFEECWSESEMAGLLASPGVAALVIEAGGAPGGLALVRVVLDEAELLTLGVLPSQRGRGAGLALLNAAETEARRAGAERLFLEVSHVNAPAATLYERAGYRQVGQRTRYYRDGADARVLARELE
ncbi:GNAT family N-acetyltransferase [Alkalicaulis satelles]|uniref:GNAT family N-acetyltransferase n=1 Tax=Alkalicaulis satelles TaxID=2609175 RepID=A0A5M6ZI47_9PROT|nr:GNAT family N-acetyltransferase [Alkalicaulis satelles]KAA5803484.1 GNAT family N-acetyltransferase [Alkalicaulis satelles]